VVHKCILFSSVEHCRDTGSVNETFRLDFSIEGWICGKHLRNFFISMKAILEDLTHCSHIKGMGSAISSSVKTLLKFEFILLKMLCSLSMDKLIVKYGVMLSPHFLLNVGG